MYSLLKTSHSHFAWLALLGIAIAAIVALFSFLSKKNSAQLKTFALVGLIMGHLQLLIGLILYFVSPLGISNMSGATMKDSIARLFAVEHPLINIIALALITIGYSKSKKQLGTLAASKTIMIFYGLGLILILSRLPWHIWP
ncbi:MAG: hypothetical protein LC107_04965 [Chitinophagales bacterium]|nr:hypothetical protein [Chitinophagales bacterium]